jgi:hypothetical protein
MLARQRALTTLKATPQACFLAEPREYGQLGMSACYHVHDKEHCQQHTAVQCLECALQWQHSATTATHAINEIASNPTTQLPLLRKLAGGPARGLTIDPDACCPPGMPPPPSAVTIQPPSAATPPLLSPGIIRPIGCVPALPPELWECLAALPLLLLLLLLPPCFHAMDAAYQVLTRPSASCAATAAVQPPGRKLPRVCRR